MAHTDIPSEARFWADYGASLRAHRLAAGMTQTQLGKHVGLDASALSRIERGENRVTLFQAFRLNDALSSVTARPHIAA